jgi:hypothetical protein
VIERAKAEEFSDEQVDRELQKRLRDLLYRDQRQSFEKYCENSDLFPEESPAKHHAFMCAALQLVAAGEIKRLMVLMPPGHGKSVYCSVRFPSWYLGLNPKHHLIHATYGGELANLNGRKVRTAQSGLSRGVPQRDDRAGLQGSRRLGYEPGRPVLRNRRRRWRHWPARARRAVG